MSIERFNTFFIDHLGTITYSFTPRGRFPFMGNMKNKFMFELSNSLYGIPPNIYMMLYYDNGLKVKKKSKTSQFQGEIPVVKLSCCNINNTAICIASLLDPFYAHIIAGDCYIILCDYTLSKEQFMNLTPLGNAKTYDMFLAKQLHDAYEITNNENITMPFGNWTI